MSSDPFQPENYYALIAPLTWGIVDSEGQGKMEGSGMATDVSKFL
jgi:hypothetical protein